MRQGASEKPCSLEGVCISKIITKSKKKRSEETTRSTTLLLALFPALQRNLRKLFVRVPILAIMKQFVSD